jgi:hypothetical protein
MGVKAKKWVEKEGLKKKREWGRREGWRKEGRLVESNDRRGSLIAIKNKNKKQT